MDCVWSYVNVGMWSVYWSFIELERILQDEWNKLLQLQLLSTDRSAVTKCISKDQLCQSLSVYILSEWIETLVEKVCTTVHFMNLMLLLEVRTWCSSKLLFVHQYFCVHFVCNIIMWNKVCIMSMHRETL